MVSNQLNKIVPWTGNSFADAIVGTMNDIPRTKTPKKLTRFELARNTLQHGFGEERTGILYYYEAVSAVDVIDQMGWWNPVYSGRPRAFAQKLLDAIPSPISGKGFYWKSIGLMYFTPPVIGRRRSRNRTSSAGLALLKHWAERYPKFKPFLDAYLSDKAEKEITLHCVDFALGVWPPDFAKQIAANNEAIVTKAKVQARAAGQAAQGWAQQMAQSQINQMNQLAQNQTAQSHMNAYQNQLQAAHQHAGPFGLADPLGSLGLGKLI